jgi:hypothetical protein
VATLEEMVADALGNELGITSALAPSPDRPAAAAEDDGRLARSLADFVRSLRPPGPAVAPRPQAAGR